jgi:tight adherence protein B
MMNILFYSFVVLLFAAVILLIEGGYLWWSGVHGSAARRIARRLRLMSGDIDSAGERVSILKQRPYAKSEWIDPYLRRLSTAVTIDRLLVQAGLKWIVADFLGATLALLCLGLLLVQSWHLPLVAKGVITLACASMPAILLVRARKARLLRIEQQLPEAADFLARAMRAGHSFTNVLQMVGSELPQPLSNEFRLVHEEINYGVPLNDALHSLAERIPLTDLRYLVIAVVIQRESGGNLAEILGNISHIIRERLKLIGKVRTLSAEGRMSAWVLGLLPFAMMAFMLAVNPIYVSILWTDPLGIEMLWAGAGMMVVGILWIRRVVHLRV